MNGVIFVFPDKETEMLGLLTIGQMARKLGVTVETLRRWDKEGKLLPQSRTLGGHRRYASEPDVLPGTKTVCYARVSTAEQKGDLERQKNRLSVYAANNGWNDVEVVADTGSGLNCRRKGLLHLLDMLLKREVCRLVIENKDRLLRFGAELLFKVCQAMGVEVVITDKDGAASAELDLAKDVISIIIVFSARLYGSRSHSRNKIVAEPLRACLTIASLATFDVNNGPHGMTFRRPLCGLMNIVPGTSAARAATRAT